MKNRDYPIATKKCKHCGEEIDVYSNAQKYCLAEDNPECESDRHLKQLWEKGRHPIQMEEKFYNRKKLTMKTYEELIIENEQLPLPSAYPGYPVEKMNRVLVNVASEVLRAKKLYPKMFFNQHEAYAVILEEVDELWAEIKKNQNNYDLDAQSKEATQAAAMLVRLIVELL